MSSVADEKKGSGGSVNKRQPTHLSSSPLSSPSRQRGQQHHISPSRHHNNDGGGYHSSPFDDDSKLKTSGKLVRFHEQDDGNFKYESPVRGRNQRINDGDNSAGGIVLGGRVGGKGGRESSNNLNSSFDAVGDGELRGESVLCPAESSIQFDQHHPDQLDHFLSKLST